MTCYYYTADVLLPDAPPSKSLRQRLKINGKLCLTGRASLHVQANLSPTHDSAALIDHTWPTPTPCTHRMETVDA